LEYNVYCDESCHLENDKINVMALGAVWLPKGISRRINEDIRNIKLECNFNVKSEAKWTKICYKHINLYKRLLDLFFDNSEIKLRCLVVPNKNLLDHARFSQSHDDWYYKMYFEMLKYVFDCNNEYNTYIDIKDTNSFVKTQKLREVCCNSIYDFTGESIKKIQPIRSHEVEIMQLVDILIGAIAYSNRVFPKEHIESAAKREIIEYIKLKSGKNPCKTTMLREDKFNIFVWQAR